MINPEYFKKRSKQTEALQFGLVQIPLNGAPQGREHRPVADLCGLLTEPCLHFSKHA